MRTGFDEGTIERLAAVELPVRSAGCGRDHRRQGDGFMQVFYGSSVFPLRGMIGRHSTEQGSTGHEHDRIERAWLLLEEVRTTYRRHPSKVTRRRLADVVDRFHEAYGIGVACRRPFAAPANGAHALFDFSANGNRR